MIHTRICDLLDIPHPIVLGGMGTATTAPLVAAVSNAGGFGTLGTSAFNAATLDTEIGAIRERTDKPFGINHLLFQIQEDMFAVTLRARPAVAAFAWARKDQDLRDYFQRAHDVGCKVMYMAGEVPEARRAAEAGADVLVAQGTEAGGHVVWMASLPLVPMMVNAVAPLPVLSAGGIADGRGLAAALALGAEGVLLGTRFHGYAGSANSFELQRSHRQKRRPRHRVDRNSRSSEPTGLARRDVARSAQQVYRALVGARMGAAAKRARGRPAGRRRPRRRRCRQRLAFLRSRRRLDRRRKERQ